MPSDSDHGHDATLAQPPADTIAERGVGETLASANDGSAGSSVRLVLPDYDLGVLLGHGGMGEIVQGRDRKIGRDVAIKQLRTDNPSSEAVTRFLREARIQARLEHPSIVPVHELGRDARGVPYFTMKKLTGTTLAELLAAATPPPRQRLLRVFVDVCLAIEFAHSKGVVHRDLKPANVMCGDFGAVYVLDWGLARIVDELEAGRSMSIDVDVVSVDGTTQAGVMLGTPGYMAPEQIEDAREVGPAADVYALGAILFEILAGEPPHPRGHGALTSTLAGVEGGPHARRPDRDIPPELDALCTAALATRPADRPTVKVLAERLQGYLDGDRDLEKRRELAAAKLAEATRALASGDTGRRAEAIKAAGDALVLDPASTEAAAIVRGLVFAPVGKSAPLPAELTRELADSDLVVQRRQGKAAILSLSAVLVYVLAAASNGVTYPALVLGIIAYILGLAAFVWFKTRRPVTARDMWLIAAGNALLAALLSRTYGSMLIVPAMTCVMALSLTSYPLLIDRVRIVILLLVVSWTTPVVLEQLGVLEPTWAIDGASVTATSHLLAISGAHTSTILIVFNIATIIVIGLFASALAVARRTAQRKVEIQEWHLRQLLPSTRAASAAG